MSDNPQAFPRTYGGGSRDGMTLRDYFAGQALAAIITATLNTKDRDVTERTWAFGAYECADAMLAARTGGA